MKKLYEDLLNDMPDGWQNAFGMDICIDIENALKEDGLYKSAAVLQVKEKFGELRIYITPTSDKVESVLDKYANLSRHTCICCGAPATRISTGWISPWCDDCAAEKWPLRDTVPIGEFYKESDDINMEGG